MISAKEAANLAANYNLSTARTMESVENTITNAAAYGNNFVVLDEILIPHEVLSSLIDNGYHIEAYHGTIIVSWDNEIVEKKINNIANTLGLNLTTNDISNYHRLSSADEINNRYHDNILDPITASNIEMWITNYIQSDSDKFSPNISCGSKFTIQDGTYNAQWLVVGADTELHKGDIKLVKPHLSLIPATDLGESKMNDSDTTYGAYANSEMNTKTIPKIVAALQKVLGSHLLARRVKLANNIDSNGKSNSNAYYTVYANLLCERQVWGRSELENSYDVGDDTEALPGFKNYKNKIYSYSGFWLRSVSDDEAFVDALGDGTSVRDYADDSNGVCPLITIG